MKISLIAGLVTLGLLGGCATEQFAEVAKGTQVNQVSVASIMQNEKAVITSGSIQVADSAALKSKLTSLADGDVLVLEPGKYPDLGKFSITANNVVIKAKVPGKTWFTGLVQMVLEGNNITVDGVVFTEGGPAERMGGLQFRGNDNTLQNSTFFFFNDKYKYQPDSRRDEYPKYLWVTLYGKNNKLLNNTFQGKHKRGTLIGVQKAKGDTTADNHVIKGNLFYDHKHNQYEEFDISSAIRYNSNSWEAIRVGDSKSSIYPSHTLIEDNLFYECDGETELVSFKSGSNILRGNTIMNSSSMVSLRHGTNNLVENNVILGNSKYRSGGIRLYDEGHVIRNNYIERVMGTGNVRGGIAINTGITDVQNGERLSTEVKGKGLNKQATPYKVTIENNTILNSRQNILYSDKMHRVSLYDNKKVSTVFAGVDVSFKNNLSYAKVKKSLAIKGNDDVAKLVNPTYENELYFGPTTGVELPTQGIRTSEPELKVAPNGLLEAVDFDGGAKGLKVLTMAETGANYTITK
ncbi:polysaccharide lyase 6 family protein [Shewanella intestini]|uniref:Alginate lyase n=1 Tax=Shewanella intestini TaxID=2017544 RepID=A0ABS5I4S6_9GAMM|nr:MULTISPECIES: polysaccharide lyase 6 family protein [Shewanella]MBR9728916.1 alginate lyase [Shewanella intestini]MRG37018.1 alginate lyase [Shewanella sp. XMDDZSB0408]